MVRRITVHPRPIREARMNAYRDQESEQWQRTYNLRAGIEGTISQAVRGPDLRHSRYRGLPKTHLQNVVTGIALNIVRLGDHFDTVATAPRRPTTVHRLRPRFRTHRNLINNIRQQSQGPHPPLPMAGAAVCYGVV